MANNSYGTVMNCHAKGNIYAEYGGSGGLLGGCISYPGFVAIVENCSSSVRVEMGEEGCLLGGLIGGTGICEIRNCYSIGEVVAPTTSSDDTFPWYVGGLVGRIDGGYIENCYARGSVKGYRDIGGLVGGSWPGTFRNCYSTGEVTGIKNPGGLLGAQVEGPSSINFCYYDSESSGESDTGKGEPKTTAEMKAQPTFAGWDFVSIWDINPNINNGYPYLKAIPPPINNLTGDGAKQCYLHSDPQTRELSLVLEPIDAATGVHMINKQLIKTNGAIPLTFDVSYNSVMLSEGPMGKGWNHNYETSLQEQENGNIQILWTANRYNTFNPSENNQYRSADQDCRLDVLVKNADGSYDLTRKDQSIYKFNALGNLIHLINGHNQALDFTYDASNRLQTITEPLSEQNLILTYNTDDLIASITDELNRQIILTYDASHNLTGITYPDTKTTTFTYDFKGHVLSEIDGEGKQVFLNTYDTQYRVISQKDGLNQNSSIIYDENSQSGKIITTITDKNGKSKIYIHDSSYQLEKITDELGNITSYTYDADGNRTSITDAANHTTTMTYDTRGNLLTITDPANHTTTFEYDDKNNLITITDANNKTTTNTYDANNNLTSTTDALNNITSFYYDANNLLTSEIMPHGGQTVYTYENGHLKTITDPVGVTFTFNYDNAGRLISTTNANNKTTSISYDVRDNIIQIEDPMNNTTNFTYDSNNTLLSKTDAKGNTTTYTYDGNLNLIGIMDALGNTTNYAYDAEGRLITSTDARGNEVKVAYDDKGRHVSITDPLGNTSKVEYDKVDNITGKYDALNKKIISVTYDILNYPITITDALGNTTINTYDDLGRLTQINNPLNQNTQFSYDDLNQLIQTTDALHGQATQEFDADGNPTSLVDTNSNRQEFTFDLAKRLTGRSSSTGNLQYTYNQMGWLDTATNGRMQTRYIQYDDAGRKVSQTDIDGTINYTYDNNGNLLTVTDDSGTITRQYDALNRVISYTDARGNTIGYIYDEMGNLTCLTYPDGKQVYYTYDAANRLIHVKDWANRITTYTYDANNRLIKTHRPDGSLETRTYDDAGKLVQQIDQDPNGNILMQFNFIYNAAGNIITESSNLPDVTFLAQNTTMTYISDNRLVTFNEETVVHDADGNMTVGPINGQIENYIFNSRNCLTAVGNTSYTYDAENNRISINESGVQYDDIINPKTSLSEVLVRNGPDNRRTFYVYGLGLIGEESETDFKVYHYDLRGSTVKLTNAIGETTDSYQYGPYGELLNHTGTSNTPFLYNGKDGVMTDGNGLYYMRARYYNPEIKRFISQDVMLGSIMDTHSLNRYTYVKANPVLLVDPTGYQYWDINFSAGYIAGGTVGILYDPSKDKLYKYVGPSATTPSASGTITYSPNDVSLGWNWGVQLSPGVGSIQFGSQINRKLSDSFGEIGQGLGLPVASASAYYVTPISKNEYEKVRLQIMRVCGYDVLEHLKKQIRCK